MPDPPAYPGAPRWVKILATVVILVVLLFLILMFTRGPGGRGHGPGLHTSSADCHPHADHLSNRG